MAVFDSREGKLVVRIVYDGPGMAGKTTNVRKLGEFFSERRRGELIVPEEIDGRTQFFDWMHLDGGLVQGYSMRCQFVTVPGQEPLERRRQHILGGADAVIFVCESTANGMSEGRELLSRTDLTPGDEGAGELPMIVQANKQDLPGGVEPHEVLAGLGLRREMTVVGAQASAGVGVRETAVLAIREVANRIQTLLVKSGIESMTSDTELPGELLAKLSELQPSDVARRPGREEDEGPIAGVPLDLSPEPVLDLEPAGVSVSAAESNGILESRQEEVHHEEDSDDGPPIPNTSVPTGHIWPAVTGRDVLQMVQKAGIPSRRKEVVGRHGLASGSGSTDLFIYRAGGWCLKTSSRRCFREQEQALNSLRDLARRKMALGEMLSPSTALAVQNDAEDRSWVWTISPWLPTLRSAMNTASEQGDDKALGEALSLFAVALIDSLLLAVRRNVALDIHPSNYVSDGAATYYLDDDIEIGSRVPSISYAMLQRAYEYSGHGEALEAYADTLERDLEQRVNPFELRRHGLADSLALEATRVPEMKALQSRMVSAVRRRSREVVGCT